MRSNRESKKALCPLPRQSSPEPLRRGASGRFRSSSLQVLLRSESGPNKAPRIRGAMK
jgi:hypothetical protein